MQWYQEPLLWKSYTSVDNTASLYNVKGLSDYDKNHHNFIFIHVEMDEDEGRDLHILWG